MSFVELVLIALGLAMDCFAVAVGVCICQRQSWRNILKMALLFGLFQGLMPVIGWLVGESLKDLIAAFDHWAAFALLAFIGGKMILQSFKQQERKNIHELKLAILLSLAVATSIDALITGLSFGFIDVNILKAGIIIFVTTFVVTIIGGKLGEKTTLIPARWAERIGGVVLIMIGIKVVLNHLELVNW
ncbi:MAG: manganese efflux pump [Bacteroidales bacterium]|nr:manganese efflux pump [Bacteroidales bacterium]